MPNIMNEYMKLTKKHITQYMKIIFDNKFDKDILEELLETYMDTRYYDLNGDKSDNTLRAEILAEIEKKRLELRTEKNFEILGYMCDFFGYILYFDRVIPNKSLEKTIERKKPDNPPIAPIITGETEAKIIALACSSPPKGYARWTLRLLETKVVELGIMEKVSDTTIGRMLKKRLCNPIEKSVGAYHPNKTLHL